MHRLAVTAILYLMVLGRFAFAADRPGFVVTRKGDTIRGVIRFAEKLSNPGTVQLVIAGGTVTDYKPTDLLAFGTASVFYESHFVNRNVSPRATADMQAGRNNESPRPQLAADSLFLRVLSIGRVILLEYIDDQDRSNFYIRKGNTLNHLINHEYFVRELGAVASTRQYVSQLRAIFSDCPSLAVPDYLAYNSRELKTITGKYSGCMGSASIEVGVQRAVSRIGLTFSGHAALLRTADASFPLVYGGGIVLMSHFAPNDFRWSLLTELNTRYYKFDETTVVGISLVPRYHIRSSSFFLDAGVSVGKAVTETRGIPVRGVYTNLIAGAGMRIGNRDKNPVYLSIRMSYGSETALRLLSVPVGVGAVGISVSVPLMNLQQRSGS